MTTSSWRLAAVCAAFSLAAAASTAEAAKGVKKTGEHTVTGIVVSVSQNAGQAGNQAGAIGSFHVKAAHHHKKLTTATATTTPATATTAKGGVQANAAAQANPAAAANGATPAHHHHHEFHVTAGTRFEGPGGTPASFAALQKGQHVRVRANGHHAQHVHIFSRPHLAAVVHRHTPRNTTPRVRATTPTVKPKTVKPTKRVGKIKTAMSGSTNQVAAQHPVTQHPVASHAVASVSKPHGATAHGGAKAVHTAHHASTKHGKA